MPQKLSESVPEGAVSVMAILEFGRSVNPVSTGGQIMPITWNTSTLGFSDLPMQPKVPRALWLVEILGHDSIHYELW